MEIDNDNLLLILDEVQEEEINLLNEWILHRKDFETPLRLAIQKVESKKAKTPRLNASLEYQLGRLDGYTEAFEAIFRNEEKIKELYAKIFEEMECGYD